MKLKEFNECIHEAQVCLFQFFPRGGICRRFQGEGSMYGIPYEGKKYFIKWFMPRGSMSCHFWFEGKHSQQERVIALELYRLNMIDSGHYKEL